VLPDRISLYRSTLERGDPSDETLRDRVRHTVVHEFAHYFGISDDRLREIDRY
jgi:predicted Zn-dependent protease with MMP-like domain